MIAARPAHLLVIDDEEEVLNAVRRILRKRHRIHTATSAEEGFRTLETHPINVVISDQRMPAMTGTEFFRRIRSRFPDVPRILLTGYADIQAVIGAVNEAGIFSYVAKPWDPPHLLSVVDDALAYHLNVKKQQDQVQRLSSALSELEEKIRRKAFELQDLTASLQCVQAEKEKLSIRYRILFNAVSDAVFVHRIRDDLRLEEFIEVNDAACARLGYTRRELLALSPADIDAGGPVPDARDPARKLAAGQNALFEQFYLTKDGRRIPVEINANAFRLDGRPAVMSIARDIADRKKVEESLKAAKEAAEASNRAKNDFLARMSHELRTPLNGILGFCEQLMKGEEPLTTGQREGLDIIDKCGEHLLEMIGDMLDFTAIEDGRIDLESEPFNLRHLIREVVRVVLHKSAEKRIVFEWELAAETPSVVRGDGRRLKQILFNIINNSIKYTHQGCIRLWVDYEDGHCRFTVSDTGMGIPPDKIDDIFLPFRRLTDAETTTDGVGLGLAICKKLVEKMGGEIGVESRKGKGSVFHVKIPAEAISHVEIGPEGDVDRKIVGFAGEKIRVLIVDDNDFNCMLLERMLSPIGFSLETAVNGVAAVEKSKTFQPHVILLDMIMPKMDGCEAAARIRRLETSKPAIIALTADATPEAREKALQSGCDDYLTKPVHMDCLLEKIGYYMGIEWRYKSDDTALDIKTDQ